MAESLDTFLGATAVGEDTWSFSIGRELHGAFGGAFGGAVAACAVRAARSRAAGRVPSSLDIRFLRGLPPGEARVSTTVLHSGRSLTTVSVDVTGCDGKHCARATVGLVASEALHASTVSPDYMAPVSVDSGGREWKAPRGVDIPIVGTLSPRIVSAGGRGVATVLSIPWEDPEYVAEAVCLAADMCVGPPVAAANTDSWIPHPNPDLSVRFAGDLDGTELVGLGRLERLDAGLALVRIEVWSGAGVVGIGVSSSMLLETKGRG